MSNLRLRSETWRRVFIAVVVAVGLSRRRFPDEKAYCPGSKTREKNVCRGRMIGFSAEMARVKEVDRGNFVWWNGKVTGSHRKCLNRAHAESFDRCAAQLLFCSLNLLFSDIPVVVAVVVFLRPIYTVQLCRIRQAYDRPTTWIVSCKSNLQLACDCRVGPKACRRPVESLLNATKLYRVNRPLNSLNSLDKQASSAWLVRSISRFRFSEILL